MGEWTPVADPVSGLTPRHRPQKPLPDGVVLVLLSNDNSDWYVTATSTRCYGINAAGEEISGNDGRFLDDSPVGRAWNAVRPRRPVLCAACSRPVKRNQSVWAVLADYGDGRLLGVRAVFGEKDEATKFSQLLERESHDDDWIHNGGYPPRGYRVEELPVFRYAMQAYPVEDD